MTAATILIGLARDGLNVERVGDGLRITPASRLTEHQRALIVGNKPELLALFADAHGTTIALIRAIERTCDARGDDAANRAALLEECAQADLASQADLLEHFEHEAIRWERATRTDRTDERGPQ